MSLRSLAEQILTREHEREQTVNKGVEIGLKSCSRPVNMRIFPLSSDEALGKRAHDEQVAVSSSLDGEYTAPFHDDGRDIEGSPPPTFYGEWSAALPNPDILTVFPKWRAILVTSTVLGLSVWVANTWDDALALSEETDFPALLLSDVLREKGKSAAETRVALLSKLINALRAS